MFDLNEPQRIIHNVSPIHEDEGVVEAPEMFKRNGIYYYLFSAGHFTQHYRLDYYMANNPEDFIMGKKRHSLTTPITDRSGKILKAEGGGSIIRYKEHYYLVHHINHYDTFGKVTTRSTYKTRLYFNPDGTIVKLNSLDITWNFIEGAIYSLDIETKNHGWIAPCIDAGFIGNALHQTYNGICKSKDIQVPVHEIKRIQICYTTTGNWSNAICKSQKTEPNKDTLHITF
jgi:hypothetical protein